MFWGHDLTWWGFVVSIATFLLCIPLTILGNVITPKLLNWWAERSVASTRKRIAALETQLTSYEAEYEQLSEAENWILRGIEMIGMTLGFVLMDLGMLFTLTRGEKSLFDDPHGLIVPSPHAVVVVAFGTFAVAFLVMSIFQNIQSFRLKRSPIVRKSIKKSIEKLKRKLLLT